MPLSRRHLLQVSGAGLLPLMPGVRVSLAAAGAQTNTLVFIFLRFGMDGLQMLAPADDAGYRDRRPNIALRTSGGGSGVQLDTLDGVQFFTHPQAGQLRNMYRDGSLAFIHAAGVPTELRSHFEIQEMVDKGLADGDADPNTGWMTRHLRTRPGVTSDFAATTDAMISATALRGVYGMVPTNDLDYLGVFVTSEREALYRAIYSGDDAISRTARKTLETVDMVRERTANVPRTTSPNYSYGLLSQKLQPLARAIKLNVGVELAAIDYGGWDHHNQLPGFFANNTRELSDALFAFTDDLGTALSRVTVVVMTEFGRRVAENANNGTDHGAASVMMVLGGGVKGGRIYGQWPGLRESDLDGGDLRVTTDYRQVLSEVVLKRQGQTAAENVFPGLAYQPLGIIT